LLRRDNFDGHTGSYRAFRFPVRTIAFARSRIRVQILEQRGWWEYGWLVVALELGEELLTLWFLAFLAIAWVVVYLPAARRARNLSPLPAVMRFKRRMKLISPYKSAGRWIVVPPGGTRPAAPISAQRTKRRRKYIFMGLLTAAVGTGIWSLVTGGSQLELHFVVDAALVFYAALLLDAKRRRDERVRKVRDLPRPETSSSDYFEVIEASGTRNA
jgi:hypothetical protein